LLNNFIILLMYLNYLIKHHGNFCEEKIMKYESLLDAIGHTPLIKIPFESEGTLYAKLEYLSPGGSVKDRSALYMIQEAECLGTLKPGGTIIEASSGNQGVAAAMIGAIKGYKVIITVSEKNSQEKVQTIKAYGAQVVVCPATERVDDPRSYHSQAVAIMNKTPNSFMLNQYFNPANANAHYHSLGPEIWQQTNGKITHYIAAAGTCGTISGAGKYLKEQNHAIKILSVDAATSFRSTNGNPKPYKLEGIGIDFDTPLLNKAIIHDYLTVTDDDAIAMLKTMASQYGFLVGPSSGAVAYAAQQYAPHLKKDDIAVMIFGDSGRAYLTKNFYN
jgi:cystathionine beta-synthase